MEILIRDDPARSQTCTDIEIVGDRTERLHGQERDVLTDLFGPIAASDPDLFLMFDADRWMSKLRELTRILGLDMPFFRNGNYAPWTRAPTGVMAVSRTRNLHTYLTEGSLSIPTNHLCTAKAGFLGCSWPPVSRDSPRLASRFTPGTLISIYEPYEAVMRGIVVPFRKSDAEILRKFAALISADSGGMMFQLEPGLFEKVDEIDFTPMYLFIIVQANISPDTIGHPERHGFLPTALEPQRAMRITTTHLKKTELSGAGIDAFLTRMLVTYFGYTGYKNATLTSIDVHEGITGRSRDILLHTKDIAEAMGCRVLHRIVDCLWVRGSSVAALKERVDLETGLSP